MILIKPSAEILTLSMDPLRIIEAAGRTCYKSEDKIDQDTAAKFVGMILKRGHESVIEHASATVRFVCDRGVSHEIVRHRIASFSQESTRYCDYQRGHVTFVIPPWVDIKPGAYTGPQRTDIYSGADRVWFIEMLETAGAYKLLRETGWKPEQARSVLPNSTKTEVVMTANLREWRHFFKLRTAPAAHPQMREVAVPLLELFKERVPVVFDDL